jgi:hypothetical protein
VFNWQYANRQVQVLNSAALQAAGITRDTQAPPRGLIQRGTDGAPTGVLENCGPLTAGFLPHSDVPEAKYLDSLEKLLRLYSAKGITSIFERSTGVDGYRTFEKLKGQSRLPVRVATTIGLSSDRTVAGTEKAIRSLPFQPGEGDSWLKVGPLKLGVDGGVLYGTAFLREPYGPSSFSLYGFNDPTYRGDLRIAPEQLEDMIRTGIAWAGRCHRT